MSNNIPHGALVLVADGYKAILLRNEESGGDVSLREERRVTPKSLLNDGLSGSRPEAQESRQTDEAIFGMQLAETLCSAYQLGKYQALVLVANPQAIGQMRSTKHKTVTASLVLALSEEPTNHFAREIAEALT